MTSADLAAHSPDQLAAWRPNLDWVTSALAVGGSFPFDRTEWLARELGIGAVVDLRVEACDDRLELDRCGIAFLHLPTEDMHGVSLPMLDEGVAFVRAELDRGRRVLVHCEHGIGRSALLCLCVLVADGMAPLDALEHLKTARERVSPSPQQFEAWLRWLQHFRDSERHAWEHPSFDCFARIAYRHLR